MRRIVRLFVVLAAVAGVALAAWRRDRRLGARFVNERVNPFLVRRAISSGEHVEIGTLEHVGRRTGTRRLVLVHPVPTTAGFRIPVPLGPKSEWARNVIAAGHCRMFFQGTTYELDEPALLEPSALEGQRPLLGRIQSWLGLQYLQLRTFASRPGPLEPALTEAETHIAAPADTRPLEPALDVVAV